MFPYTVASCRLYSSEKEEQSQRKGNAQVEVNKVVKLLNQLVTERNVNMVKGQIVASGYQVKSAIFELTSMLSRK